MGLGGNRVIICSILFTFGVISPPEAGKDKSVSVRYVELAIQPQRDLYGYNLRFRPNNYGHKTKIFILLHEEVPLVWLRKLIAILGKIGAQEMRYFYFDDDKKQIGITCRTCSAKPV